MDTEMKGSIFIKEELKDPPDEHYQQKEFVFTSIKQEAGHFFNEEEELPYNDLKKNENLTNKEALFSPDSILDNMKKEGLPEEICGDTIKESNSESMAISSSSSTCSEDKQQWKSPREDSKRDFILQNCSSEGDATNKRKYINFDQLLSFETCFSESESNYLAVQSDQDMNEETDFTQTDSTDTPIYRRPFKRRKSNLCSQEVYEEKLINLLKEKTKDCEDKLFLMSLLKRFKKFNLEQRREARTEILNIMNRVQLIEPPSASTLSQVNSNYQLYIVQPNIPQYVQVRQSGPRQIAPRTTGSVQLSPRE